jgi:uncharacterized protein
MIHSVVFKVTHACNLACRYCYAVDRASRLATRATLRSVIQAAVQLDADTVNFIWHGGEPLLAGLDFFAEAVLLQKAAADGTGKRFQNCLQTNGTLVNSDYAEFFRKNDFSVGVSLDGPAHVHDGNRISVEKQGSYEPALRGYQTLKAGGVKTGVICVIDPMSSPETEIFLDWLENIDAKSVSLSPLFAHRTDLQGDYPMFLGSLKESIPRRGLKIRVRELILAGTSLGDREKMGLLDACHPGWPCYETISTVDEEGYVYFGCDRFLDSRLSKKETYRLGHINNGGFRKALASRQFSELSALADKQKHLCASACNLFSTCDGGCVADWLLMPPDRSLGRPNVVFCRAVEALTDSHLPLNPA